MAGSVRQFTLTGLSFTLGMVVTDHLVRPPSVLALAPFAGDEQPPGNLFSLSAPGFILLLVCPRAVGSYLLFSPCLSAVCFL